VKYRSNCKVCSACPHGRRRTTMQGVRWGCNLRARSSCALNARSAAGHQSASTVVSALNARSAVGLHSASTVVSALDARSAVGQSASIVSVLTARSAVRSEHGRQRSSCKECGGSQSASTVVSALCMQGVRWGINLRARSSALLRSAQESASGSSISTVVIALYKCKECGGSSICEHGRGALIARSAVGQESASTVVSAENARSASPRRRERNRKLPQP